jgi:hypothetical protein
MQDVCKYASRQWEPRHRCNELQEQTQKPKLRASKFNQATLASGRASNWRRKKSHHKGAQSWLAQTLSEASKIIRENTHEESHAATPNQKQWCVDKRRATCWPGFKNHTTSETLMRNYNKREKALTRQETSRMKRNSAGLHFSNYPSPLRRPRGGRTWISTSTCGIQRCTDEFLYI